MANFLSKETVSVGVLAVLAGLVGAYGIRSALQPAPPEEPKKPDVLKVPIAASDLPAGRVVAIGDVAAMSLTHEQLAARKLPLDQVMLEAKQVYGRRVQKEIKQGQPFLTGSLYLAGMGPNIAEKLKPGFRAVSVEVPPQHLSGVGIGSTVDLFFRAAPRAGSKGARAIPEVTLALLTQMEVIDMDHTVLASSRAAHVTLAVPADQVATVRAVQGRGEFSLVPRPKGEAKATAPPGKTTLEDALGIPPPPPDQQPFQTAIFRRSAVQVNRFVANTLTDQQGDCPGCGGKGAPTAVPPSTLQPQPDPSTQPPPPTVAPPKPAPPPASGASASVESPVYYPLIAGGGAGQAARSRGNAGTTSVAPKRPRSR